MTLVLNKATTVLPVDDANVPSVSMPTPWGSRTMEWQTTEVKCSAARAAPCCS